MKKKTQQTAKKSRSEFQFPKSVETIAEEEPEIFSEDRIFKIHLDNIVPCPFEPQSRRRAKFKPEEIESLGSSILKQGLFSPIVVRPRRDIIHHDRTRMQMYEIVFGERRWLASRRKDIETIKCFVRDLSDAEVLEMQYQENHQRNENDPLDDAFLFKFLQERENYSISALADKFGTTDQTVINKLKLNDLIAEAREELSSGKLPLRHAYYMARFPIRVQREIHEENLAYLYYDADYRATGYKLFVEEIDAQILLRLADAPFSTIDPRLHIKGLICPNCTERTGYSPMLFPDLTADDSCLNKSCFKIKSEVHLTLRREAIAARMPNPENKTIAELAKDVPLVTERAYTDSQTFKEKPRVNQKLQEIPECEFSVLSLPVDGKKQGQNAYTCRRDDCPVHHPAAVPDISGLSTEKLEQLENDFNERVADAVRIKVLTMSLHWFDDYKSFWTFDDSIKKLIVEGLFNFGSLHAHILLPILKLSFKDAPRSLHDKNQIRIFADNLDKRGQSQILFLLSVASAADELEVLKIAVDYTNADYLRLDAETRFELAPTEFKASAAEYLEAVKSGNAAEVPHFWLNFDDVGLVSEEEN